jgi:hypothetical protein
VKVTGLEVPVCVVIVTGVAVAPAGWAGTVAWQEVWVWQATPAAT